MTHSDERREEERERPRVLPTRITIPDILGEMVYLRPATSQDLPLMDELDAYVNASGITGKDRVAERAAVHAWVRRSEAWTQGSDVGEGVEFERSAAFAVDHGEIAHTLFPLHPKPSAGRLPHPVP